MTPPPGDALRLPRRPRVEGLEVRSFQPGRDYVAVAELLAAVHRHDGIEWLPTADQLRNDWEHHEGFDPEHDVVLAEVGGVVIGMVQVDWRLRAGRVVHQLGPIVAPAWRRRGLGRALLEWGEDHARTGAAGGAMGSPPLGHVLAGWGDVATPGVAALAGAAGYAVAGYGIMMVRSLAEPLPDAPLPPGLEVRPVRPADHRAIWDADCEAFQDQREPATRTDADFEHWFSIPELDTELWDVAWDRDEVAGSVMTFVYPAENAALGLRRGWLEHVSVRRPWRRRGLARALLVRAMARLRAMDLADAALGADAENLSGAVRLYESLGFRRVQTSANYRKPLDLDARASAAPAPGP